MFFNKLANYIRNNYHIVKKDLIDWHYCSNNSSISETLLIIKIDAIGDYILFRNFLKDIKKSSRFKDYKVTLCGNILWKDLSLHFDSTCVDEFIWINPSKLSNERYKRETEIMLYKLHPEIVIYPSYSRTPEGDSLAIRTGATKKITFLGDSRNIDKKVKSKNDKLYDELIDIPNQLDFEFNRNKAFFSKLLLNTSLTNKPTLKQNEKCSDKIVISPGASSSIRAWPIEYFHEIASYITAKYKNNFTIYLCGSNQESLLAEKFSSLLPKVEYVDLTSKFSLVEFAQFVSDATLVITNDSGPLHIAAACNVNVLAISNGNNYGRFVPYPAEFSHNVRTIFPMELNNIDLEAIRKLQNNDSPYQINSVSIDQAIRVVKSILD